ncbi:metal-dependent hydrolase [Paenibacillus tarimensis]|uniref:metal-dependent hydrolase n=1 Tax=Paenibacillus tarimensis TaxID=416012 RepID=UPI001F2DEC06|nr:metal-dependent hydrolase [Paenibacillus tarimensis]MCF2943135.1 permease [Paenibacillus tarimensis]
MFAGHFGLAAIIKAKQPQVPLWALMTGTQLLDIAFVPLFLAGVETIETIGDGHGEAFIHAGYSHSLASALLLSILAGLLSWRKWGRSSGLVIGGTVFSHWLLDLLVHRPDIPILPGNIGGLPLLGIGLWRWPVISITVEALLVLIGVVLYFWSAVKRSESDGVSHTAGKGRALLAGSVVGLLLVLSLVTDLLGIN